jgi:hypothetical protein
MAAARAAALRRTPRDDTERSDRETAVLHDRMCNSTRKHVQLHSLYAVA